MTTTLHKLALALGTSPLTKEAVISPQQDAAIKQRLEAKAQDLAQARAGTKAYAVAPTLIDKEIQKSHGLSTAQQLKHKVRRGAKGFWSGRTGLGGKWRNRAALLGGLGLLGGGIKAHMNSQKPAPEVPRLQPEATPMAPAPGPAPSQMRQYTDDDLAMYLSQMYPRTVGPYASSKMGNYSPSASMVPAPPVTPRITAPGPSVAGIPQLKPGEPPKLPGARKGVGERRSSSYGPSAPKAPGAPKTAENEALYPLVAAGLGGLGGHALGEKILAPLIKMRERTLLAKIQNSQDALAALQKTQKKAPGVMAATSALLLAALTALAIRNKQSQPVDYSQFQAYDTSGGGFHPSQAQSFGSY